MHSRPNKMINLDFILVIAIIIAVLVILVVYSFEDTGSTPGETEADISAHPETSYVEDTSASEEESTESEYESELKYWYMEQFSDYDIDLSAPTTTIESSFNTTEEIYQYATEQINTRKYYSAIKYLQKIPDYKDSTQLQMKIYALINQRLFTTGSTSDNLFNDNCIQQLDIGYIDSNGDLLINTTGISDYTYNNLYIPLLNLNKTTKFQSLVFNKETMTSSNISGALLTQSGDIISFSLDFKTNELHFSTIDCSILASGERIVHITTEQAVSNKGNVYNFYSYKLSKSDIEEGAIIIANSFLYVTAEGTLVNEQPGNYTSFPALQQWSDIICFSTERDIFNCYPEYCVGLTSSGAVYLALPNDSVTKRILDKKCTYIEVKSFGDHIVAITDTGDLHTYYIPYYPK